MNAPAGWYPTPDGGLRYWDGTRWTSHVATAPTGPRPPAGPNPTAPTGRPSVGAKPAGRVSAPAWFGWGGLVVVASFGALSSGVSGGLSLAGVYLFVVAVIALVRGRVRWARLRSRAAGAGALGVALVLTAVGGATATPTDPTPEAAPSVTRSVSPTTSSSPSPTLTASPSATPSPTVTPSPTRSAASPATAAKGTALAAVAKLTVKGRAPKTGYSRDAFGQAWFDTNRNGCDTRNDILRRDLVNRDMKNWCKVLAGTRKPDPYTGRTIRFVVGGASEIDIDHVVALSDAWQKGAAKWAAGKRLAFANDPLNLLAVDAGANRSKGDGDAATWLPPNKSFRCQYVARQVAVKLKYQVWVTTAERDAMVRVLSKCPGHPLPAPGSGPHGCRPAQAAHPRPQPCPSTTAPSSVYYENCDAVRAAGAAPLHAGDPGYSRKLDRDGDGVACE